MLRRPASRADVRGSTAAQDDVFIRTVDPNATTPKPTCLLIQRLDARAERGFSMFIVIMAMSVTSMFVAAAFAAANGDLPLSARSKDRKATYAAAEAGLATTSTTCSRTRTTGRSATGAAPNATENSPINQQWDGAGVDPRVWRKIPGSNDAVHDRAADTKDSVNGDVLAHRPDSSR